MLFWLIYLVLGLAHLTFLHFEIAPANFISKALLMPAALLALYNSTKASPGIVKWVLVGLVFGWMGDILLHFKGFSYFISGLSAFLVGHICYIRAFGSEVRLNKVVHFIMEKPYLILPFIGFFVYIIYSMNDYLDDVMRLPVYLYCFVILLMSLMAVNRYHVAGKASWLLVFAGSIFFVASDYVLAMRMFVWGDFPGASFIIMSTYIAGQGLIAYGIANAYKGRN